MIRPSVPPLLAVPLLLAPLHAEEKTVTVTESALSHQVHFDTPTPGDAVSATTAVRHVIIINNGDSRYDMAKADVESASDTDAGSWRCVDSTTTLMRWKILALRNTALAFTISGGLTEILQGGAGGGAPRAPKKKSFSVEVPAATVLRWNNVAGSHANPAAQSRLRVAVGERVSLHIKNSHLGNPVWTASHGWLFAEKNRVWQPTQEHQPSVEWAAPSEPAENCTITATFPKGGEITGGTKIGPDTVRLSFQVVAPEGETVERVGKWERVEPDTSTNKTSGQLFVVGMTLHYTLQPRDVNYSWTRFAEESAPEACRPQALTGYHKVNYDRHLAAGGTEDENLYTHRPEKKWRWNDEGLFQDKAETKNFPIREGPTTGDFRHRWEGGSYHWKIPAKYKGIDPRVKDWALRAPGEGLPYNERLQKFAIQVTPEGGGVIGQTPMSVTVSLEKTAKPGEAKHHHTASF